MKSLVFSVYDAKAEAYMAPFVAASKGFAIRMFLDEASRPDSMCAKHPEDFRLFHVGEFDDATAVVTMLPGGPVSQGLAQDLLVAARGDK